MDSAASAMVPRLLLARAPLVGVRRLFEPQGVGNAGTKKAPMLAGDEIGKSVYAAVAGRSGRSILLSLETNDDNGRGCPTDEQSKLLKALGCDEVHGSMLSAACLDRAGWQIS